MVVLMMMMRTLFAALVFVAASVAAQPNLDCRTLPTEIQKIIGRGVNIRRSPAKWQDGLKPIFTVEPRHAPQEPNDPYWEPPTRQNMCYRVLSSELIERGSATRDNNNQNRQNSQQASVEDQRQSDSTYFRLPQGFRIRPQWNQNKSEKTKEQTRFNFATKTRPTQLETLPTQFSRLYAQRDPLLTRAFGDKLQTRNYVSGARIQDQKYFIRTELSGGQNNEPPVDGDLLNMLHKIATSNQEPSLTDYNRLFSTYGTHFIQEGALGGAIEILYMMNEKCSNDSSTPNTTWIDRQTTHIDKLPVVMGGDRNDGLSVGDCIGLNLEKLPSETCERTIENWRRSLYSKPALVLSTLKLRELSDLADGMRGFSSDGDNISSHIMATLRQRIKTGLQQFLSGNDQKSGRYGNNDGSQQQQSNEGRCSGAPQCQNGGKMLTFFDDNNNVACQCVCPEGWYGQACERNLCADPPPAEDERDKWRNNAGAVGMKQGDDDQSSRGRGVVIQCYQCNAKDNGSACTDENINTNVAEQFLVKCNAEQMRNAVKERMSSDNEPFDPARVRCRKLIQNVQGEEILFRECAYMLPVEAEKGDNFCTFRSSGTKDINYKVCYCNSDRCNAASPRVGAVFTTILFITSLLMIIKPFFSSH